MITLALAPIGPPFEDLTGFCQRELERLAQITHPNRRAEYIAGHQLLRHLARQTGHIRDLNDSALHWHQPERAAPRLIDYPHIQTGLSHCRGWVLAALADTGGTSPLGIDLELVRARKNLRQLAHYSFGQSWLNQQTEATLSEAFFLRWTQCEAVVKASTRPLGIKLLREQQFIAQASGQSCLLGASARIDHPVAAQISLAIDRAPRSVTLLHFEPKLQRFTTLEPHWVSWATAD